MQVRRESTNHMVRQVDQAEKATEAGNLQDDRLMVYHTIETAMIELAKARNLPHTGHASLTRLATALNEEHGTPGSHIARLEAARAMYDNAQLHFLDVEETLMSPENAREMIRASTRPSSPIGLPGVTTIVVVEDIYIYIYMVVTTTTIAVTSKCPMAPPTESPANEQRKVFSWRQKQTQLVHSARCQTDLGEGQSKGIESAGQQQVSQGRPARTPTLSFLGSGPP